METYAIKNLSFRYPETGIDVLKDITFSVNEGEFITVCGSDLKVLVMTTIQSEKELPKQLHFSESKIILKKVFSNFRADKSKF